MYNNTRNLKFKYFKWKYTLYNNRNINDNLNQPVNGFKFNNINYVWLSKWCGLVHEDYINSKSFLI